MKIKLFISSSLGLAGVWLAAAYLHTVDLSSYTPTAIKPVQMESKTANTDDSKPAKENTSVALTQ